jgi:hypothetical protein
MRRDREFLTTFTAFLGVVVALASMLPTFFFKVDDVDGLYWIPVICAAFAGISSVYILRRKEQIRRKRRVFIIYSHEDYQVAAHLVEMLRENGFDPWFDQNEIVPGQRVEEAVTKGLSQSAIAILLVSKNIENASNAVSFQLAIALSSLRGKNELYSPVIPVLLDDQPPPEELRGIRSCRLEDDKDFDFLVRGLNTALETQ